MKLTARLRCLLYREPIDDSGDLARHPETFRVEFNTIRPHEHLSQSRLRDTQIGLAAAARKHPSFLALDITHEDHA